jgi:streptomycin 6-kinase
MQNSTVVRRWNLLKISGNQSFLTPLEGRLKYPDSAPLPTAMTPLPMGFTGLVRRWRRDPHIFFKARADSGQTGRSLDGLLTR